MSNNASIQDLKEIISKAKESLDKLDLDLQLFEIDLKAAPDKVIKNLEKVKELKKLDYESSN